MSIIAQIEQAGVVGAGGAGFPSHVKFKAKVEYLIVNAAECEPLLQTDHYIMLHHAKEVITAIERTCEEVEATHAIVATKAYYKAEIQALEQAIKSLGSNVRLHFMDNFYPAGDEQVMVYEVTGRVVPQAGIPLMVGCIVTNITTMYNVYHAITTKQPVTTKQLTVIGQVREPTLIEAPIGTSFGDVLAAAGGCSLDNYLCIDGGPMMGNIYHQYEIADKVVTKTTSALIIKADDGYLSKLKNQSLKRIMAETKSSCVQCTLCTELCPRQMLGHAVFPHRVMRYFSGGKVEISDNEILIGAQLCCSCGVCEVIACPMGISPRQVNEYVKDNLGKLGVRYTNEKESYIVDSMRDYRAVSPKNILIKMGLSKYQSMILSTMKKIETAEVVIPLQMHIGAPSVPVVTVGDHVCLGDLIADIPQKALGAKVHASIAGQVMSVDNQQIHIKKV